MSVWARLLNYKFHCQSEDSNYLFFVPVAGLMILLEFKQGYYYGHVY